ncbi:MAG: HAMP domain-containing protein [Alphaproteobacteria bacterium]|nr:HAMP domain-containing protein [Alphaproteobacteria bacterium]MCB9930007.1 HAMP domain-containing protein [Alphaproteobacteria bacterium]
MMARVIEATPPAMHHELLRVASTSGFRFGMRQNLPGLPPAPFFETWLEPHLRAQGLQGTLVLRLAKKKDDDRSDPDDAGDLSDGGLIAVPLKMQGHEAWLTLEAKRWHAPNWPRYAMVSFLLAGGGSAIVIFLLVRRAMRPLHALSQAAERLGRGETVPPLAERGPIDIRLTTAAFNQMQDRLQRFVSDRTRMLAAISHDLRSPITALRLRAEMVDQDDVRERMIASLDDMQQMVEATLAFARQDAENEPTQRVDLASLGRDLAEERAEIGQPVRWEGGAARNSACRPVALRRALGNLIDNAVRYGGGARLRLEPHGFVIEDDGPGIPEDRLSHVFEPFARLEESRNAETGGTGLGLAIARSIARSHGGDVILRNRNGGGLTAMLVLPA